MNDPLSDRKRQLIAQAAVHRMQLQKARQGLSSRFQPQSLAKGAAGGLAMAALALFKNKKPAKAAPVTGLAALLPLAIKGISLLSKTGRMQPGRLRPVARKIILIGAVGALTAFAAKMVIARRRSDRK